MKQFAVVVEAVSGDHVTAQWYMGENELLVSVPRYMRAAEAVALVMIYKDRWPHMRIYIEEAAAL